MSDSTQRIPTHMPTANRSRNLGKTLDDDTSRLDAVAKVTGRARYSRDMYLPNGLFACFIRCPYGAATLEAIDEAAAMAVPGVLEVKRLEQQEQDKPRGRYHGHPAGWLVAESPHAMRRGMRALAPQWKIGQFDSDIDSKIDAPPPPPAAIQALLDGADFVHEARYSTQVQTHSALETHGGVIDHRGDSATCYISTQGTFAARDGLQAPLGLPQSSYEVVCEYIGGAFGSKLNGAGKEGATAAEISAKYKRPVYLFVNRAEDHLDTGNRPSSRTHVRIACKRDGTVLGGQVHTWGGVGVGRRGGGVACPSGRYDLGDIDKQHEDVEFNGGAPRPFRAPGHPQGAFTEELILEEIAARAGVDPLELRLRLDTDGDRRKMFELGAEIIGWKQRQPGGSQKGVIRRGFGLGATSWPRFPSPAQAVVAIHEDGSVEAMTGSQDIGTGQRTVMGVVVADSLGIPLDRVRVNIGRSSLPYGPASGGSVTAHTTVPAMTAAAGDALEELLKRAAAQLGAPGGSLSVADGAVLREGQAVMSWREACAQFAVSPILGRGEWGRRSVANDTSSGHSHGVQFVELRVDTETGVVRVERIVAVQSCGRIVCRKTAESQIIGGVIQGIGYALFENKILDPQLGAMVNPNLEMYKIPGTVDMPHIEPVLWDSGTTAGVRSLGEPPTIPTAGAIAGAVFNAIGRPVRHLPLTPDKILAALKGDAA